MILPSARPASLPPFQGIGTPELAIHGFLTGCSPTQESIQLLETYPRRQPLPLALPPAVQPARRAQPKPTHPPTNHSGRLLSVHCPGTSAPGHHRTYCYFHPVPPSPSFPRGTTAAHLSLVARSPPSFSLPLSLKPQARIASSAPGCLAVIALLSFLSSPWWLLLSVDASSPLP
ncbi:uncharacterized protein BO80DRAFT_184363 [Aspergillus ibericus CBS 121593]|uniref:Uncharacterized protein n=1 Tax=Aspergillus ibericus CBS 121593 TaxID=1448316 RepID=A0A395GQB7_9EURO|nr:hypothetical protein BO80DRAFT_184363 [Aspergillus ibericus CBS 121593]RAK97710.1 hypothetical protein BO80DRAFT_184363 [Aspergillus ibericus CBS 121593]